MKQNLRVRLLQRLLFFVSMIAFVGFSARAWAQAPFTASSLTITENFNTLAITGTSSTVPTGFSFVETGANANATYSAGTGSGNGGDTYSFGSASNTDRAFGGLRSGNLVPVIGASFINNTGSTITSLSISYTGEQWRLGTNTTGRATDRLDFQYSTSTTSLTTGTYTDVDALDFSSPTTTGTVGPLDGNLTANRTVISAIITNLNIVPGATFFIRFNDFDVTSSDDGLAIDDLTVTATTAGPAAPTLTANPTSLTGASGLQYVLLNGPATAPVSVSGTNFTVASGNVTATSSNPSQFTVTPVLTGFTNSSLTSTTFTVGLVAGLVVGSAYSASITFEGGGATVVVPVSGTVTATPPPPNLTINDVTAAEGNAGTTTFSFTVSLSAPAPAGGVTFNIATQDGTATTATNDYVAQSLTSQTIPAGASTYIFDVTVNGDVTSEPNESFSVVVSTVTGANVTDGVGIGTITNDDAAPPTLIRTIQGAGHISPLAGTAVTNVNGIVTTLRSTGFWMQDPNPDANDNTSEGIFVFTSTTPAVSVSQAVQVNGTVQELRLNANNLSSTQITSPTVVVVSSGNALPAPIVISSQAASGVRLIPTGIISNDYPASGDVELSTFDPVEDGLDFFETLEGMRVQVNSPVTSGFRNDFGELFVVADGGAGATGFNSRKTITISGTGTTNITAAISNSDFNPERIQIDDVLYGTGNTPDEDPGSILSTIIGVVNYDFQSYEILPSVAPTVVTPANNPKEISSLVPTANQLTIASFNVENLAGNEPQTKYDGLATAIVTNLRSPDILALEEIQDNDGATNNSDVDATTTLNRLISAITTAGGPTYQFRQINPVDDQDGGQPGGNIRVGFLFNPARVSFVDRPGGGSSTNTTVSNVGGQPRLSASPGRILDPNPGESDLYPGDDFTATRKPLVGEFTFNGQTIFAIVNHFSSRGGSGPLTGRFQPPAQGDQERREEQGKIVNAFVDQLLAVNPNTNVVVLGDFNEFQFFPALQYLIGNVPTESPVLTNLIESLPIQERYTYIFDGNAQALDYILASNNMNSKLDAFDAVHINAEYKVQLSDHDPSVARFNLPLLTATLVASVSAVCPGTPVTLSATVAGLSGATYALTITNGTEQTTATGLSASAVVYSLTPTVPGAFTLTVLTSTSATASAVSGTVIVNATPANASLTSGTLICQQTSVTLIASATDGTSYTFANSSGIISSTGNMAAVTTTGTYTVTISNTSGCTASATATVGQSLTLPAFSVNSATTCSGTVATLTASGCASGSISWPTAFTGTGLSRTVSPAMTTIYDLTCTVGTCTTTASGTVTVNPRPSAPTYTLTNNGTVCAGNALTVTANGCNSGTVSFTINPTIGSGSVSPGPPAFYVFAANTLPGTYTVCARCTDNGTGCTSPMALTTVTIEPLPSAMLTASSSVFCSGNSVTLTASGGTSYTFTGPGGLNQQGGNTTAVVSTSGTYTVVVANAAGCSNTATVTISELASGATFILPASASTVCEGSSFSLPVTVNGSASMYQWHKDGVLLTNQMSATLTLGNVQVSDAGTYSLVINGGCGNNGNSGSTPFTLTVNPQPTITLTFPGGTVVVTGNLPTIQLPAPGQVLVQASGGTAYNWVSIIERINGYELRKTDNNTSGLFTIDKPGPYRVTVSGANGCTRTVEGLIVN